MKLKHPILTILLLTYLLSPCFSQNWEPEWGVDVTKKNAGAYSYIMDIDYENNVYTSTRFGDSIFFGDTLFTTNAYYDWVNWAIAKYDNNGRFQTAFDITSSDYGHISDVSLVTDNDLNIYISCEYQKQVNILDTTIYNTTDSTSFIPEVFLLKLTHDLEIEWVRQISSPTQDVCHDLAISSDNFLYMAVEHYKGYPPSIDTVNYFDQDTAF